MTPRDSEGRRISQKQRLVLGWTAIVVLAGAVAILFWLAYHFWGPFSVGFSFAVVWLPMMWLGTASRVVTPRLPASYHNLRAWERDGRVYEWVGIRLFKRLLRRGPMSVFNPHLRLPEKQTPDRIAFLRQRMCDAEASHAILFVLTNGYAVYVALIGVWLSTLSVLLFNLFVNGYPVMLQRYNRALLAKQFGKTPK